MKTSQELAAQVMQKIQEREAQKKSRRTRWLKGGALCLLLAVFLPLGGKWLNATRNAPQSAPEQVSVSSEDSSPIP